MFEKFRAIFYKPTEYNVFTCFYCVDIVYKHHGVLTKNISVISLYYKFT